MELDQIDLEIMPEFLGNKKKMTNRLKNTTINDIKSVKIGSEFFIAPLTQMVPFLIQ